MGIVIIVVVLVGAYVAGRILGASGNTPTVTPGTNTPDLRECHDACNQWDQRRAERCNAEKDEAAAKAKLDALKATLLAAAAQAAAAAAAAWTAVQVCNAIPFPPLKVACYAVAAALVAYAAALALYSAYVLGQVGAAESDYAAKSNAASAARAAETQARGIMTSKCPEDEISKCLARPSPC